MSEKKLNIVDLWYNEQGTLLPNVGTARIFPNARYQSAVLSKFENVLPTDVVEVIYQLPNNVVVEPQPMMYSGQYLYDAKDFASFIHPIPQEVTSVYKRDRDVTIGVTFTIRRFTRFLGYVYGASSLQPYTSQETGDLIFVMSDKLGEESSYFKYYATVQDAIDDGVTVAPLDLQSDASPFVLYEEDGEYFVYSRLNSGNGYLQFNVQTNWIDTGTPFGSIPPNTVYETIFGNDVTNIVVSKGLPYEGKMTTISQVDTILMLIASIRGEMGALINVNDALQGNTIVARINDLYLKHLTEIERLDGEVARIDQEIEELKEYDELTFLKKDFKIYDALTDIPSNEDVNTYFAVRDEAGNNKYVSKATLDLFMRVLANNVVEGAERKFVTAEQREGLSNQKDDYLNHEQYFFGNKYKSYLKVGAERKTGNLPDGERLVVLLQPDGTLGAFGKSGTIMVKDGHLKFVTENHRDIQLNSDGKFLAYTGSGSGKGMYLYANGTDGLSIYVNEGEYKLYANKGIDNYIKGEYYEWLQDGDKTLVLTGGKYEVRDDSNFANDELYIPTTPQSVVTKHVTDALKEEVEEALTAMFNELKWGELF